ncbi:MAG: ATP-binding cassette domain-containing protein, partial [Acidobacteria bacterium]|nr:ATP-binding cassette domain-containing protein [Acidobacteriota bacterium]
MPDNNAGPTRLPGTSALTPAMVFRGLVKNYGKVQALCGLDLNVKQGEVYGFLGRNGAGKSTAIRIAMGISNPTAGTVLVFGETMTAGAVNARRRIGYVAQE